MAGAAGSGNRRYVSHHRTKSAQSEQYPRRVTTARMVIEEALRLYPPIWAVPRQAVCDDEIGGFRIPTGSTAALCPFVTHRHPDIWERSQSFDPDQFTPGRVAGRPKGGYFPFLGGPHQCIGNEFAMLEMVPVLATVLRKFDPELLPDRAIRPAASLTFRPNGPVRLALRGTDRRGRLPLKAASDGGGLGVRSAAATRT